jgi:hypothetical protein
MNLRGLSVLSCGLTLAVILIAGCGGGSANPKTYPVTGTVMHQGAPVTDASVTFSPVDASGQAATGQTDSAGRYVLSTFQQGDGALPGEYTVRVVKYDRSPTVAGSSDDDWDNYTPPQEQTSPPPAPKLLVPANYASERTPLRFVVENAGENQYDIVLEGR